MQAWVIRPYPHQNFRMQEFVQKQIIAVGWPNIGDLTALPPAEIEARLRKEYPERSDRWRFNATGTLLRFLSEMAVTDLVIVAPRQKDSPNVSLARLVGLYRFDPRTDGHVFGYPHHRPVKWLRHDVPRQTLPRKVLTSLHSQLTLFKTDCDAMIRWDPGLV